MQILGDKLRHNPEHSVGSALAQQFFIISDRVPFGRKGSGYEMQDRQRVSFFSANEYYHLL